MRGLPVLGVGLFFFALCVSAADWIAPNTVWYDTDGKKIEAHGGGVVQRGDTFYWIGHRGDSK